MIGLLIAFGIERFDGARERFADVIELEPRVFEDEFARPYHAGRIAHVSIGLSLAGKCSGEVCLPSNYAKTLAGGSHQLSLDSHPKDRSEHLHVVFGQFPATTGARAIRTILRRVEQRAFFREFVPERFARHPEEDGGRVDRVEHARRERDLLIRGAIAHLDMGDDAVNDKCKLTGCAYTGCSVP